jgi:hypothetical protein
MTERKAKRLRARVSNAADRGELIVANAPGDSLPARRMSDIYREIVSDLGGAQGMSEAQRQIARRAAVLAVACEQLEAEFLVSGSLDVATYAVLTDRQGRAFTRLGMKRHARQVNAQDWINEIAEEYRTAERTNNTNDEESSS